MRKIWNFLEFGGNMYRITFVQIHYFLAVAKELNFTTAAESVYISQPALSKQIRLLEEELGFLLFQRDTHGVTLTPEGSSLYKSWVSLEKIIDTSIYDAKSIHPKITGKLNIGCAETFQIEDSFFDMVEDFQKDYPCIAVNFGSHSLRALNKRFKHNELDMVFVPEHELSNFGNVQCIRIQKLTLGIAIATSNPLSARQTLSLIDIKAEKFIAISPKESAIVIEKIKSICRPYGFEPKNVKYVPNLYSLLLAIKKDAGVAVCSPCKAFDNEIKFFPLTPQPNDTDIFAVWDEHKTSNELDLFKKRLHEKATAEIDKNGADILPPPIGYLPVVSDF
jgi:DNA-binding transcriptional LysR family regulator